MAPDRSDPELTRDWRTEVPRGRRIYGSVQFEDDWIVKQWRSWLAENGWELAHWRVDEEQGSPEHLLGQEIRRSTGLLALAREDDVFGLPWWVFQEIDFAKTCGIPVMLVTSQDAISPAEIGGIREWLATLSQS